MKGLLIKDYRLLLAQKTLLAVTVFMGILYLAIYEDPTFAIIFIIMMWGIFTISTISYDDLDNGLAYLFTLPISRKDYVIEKYVFTILNTLSSGLVMFTGACIAVNVRGIPIKLADLGMGLTCGFLVAALITGCMIPLQIKFDAERSRLVLISGMAVIFLAAYFLVKTTKAETGWGLQFIEMLNRLSNKVIVLLILVLIFVITCISCLVTLKIIKKREF